MRSYVNRPPCSAPPLDDLGPDADPVRPVVGASRHHPAAGKADHAELPLAVSLVPRLDLDRHRDLSVKVSVLLGMRV